MVFNYIPCTFHCGFSLHTQCISLWFFITYPVHFIATFHSILSSFHCSFSNVALGISLWFFNRYPQHFIVKFSNVALEFHCDLSNVALDISLQISYRCLVLSMTISFLAPEYFIVLKIARKWEQKIGMVYRMSDTAFRVYCIYSIKEISSIVMKKWRKTRQSWFCLSGSIQQVIGRVVTWPITKNGQKRNL